MNKFLLIAIAFASNSSIASAQWGPDGYSLNGTLKDPNGAVIAGVTIFVENSKKSVVTDINGDFKIDIPAGDFVLRADPTDSYDLRAFIKIRENGLNPQNVQFTIDPGRFCCSSSSSGVAFPKPTSLPAPGFPPAAAATRTFGEVVVTVTINREGRVTAARAERGHPLLRASAVAAARGARFESSDANERLAKLTYVFLSADIEKRVGIKGYSNPYRIDVVQNYVFNISTF